MITACTVNHGQGSKLKGGQFPHRLPATPRALPDVPYGWAALWPPASGLLCLVRKCQAWAGTQGSSDSQSSPPSRAQITGPNTTIILSELASGRSQPFLMIKNLTSCIGCPIYELAPPAFCLMRSKFLWANFCALPSSLFHTPVCWAAFSPMPPFSYTLVICNPSISHANPRHPVPRAASSCPWQEN